MNCEFREYLNGVAAVGVGAIVGITLKRSITREENRNALMYDVLDAVGTSVFWPIALPIQIVIIVDGIINGAKTYVARQKMPSVSECVICMDKPRAMVISVCGHLSMCDVCAFTQNKCPICRTPYNPDTQLIKVFMT